MVSNLYPYQTDGIEWLKAHRLGLLYDDPGLGKTVQAIQAWPSEASAIVVCPASVKPVWSKEVQRWRPGMATSVLTGRKSFRYPGPNEAVITNYDILPEIPPACYHRYQLVGDEIHACKSVTTNRSKRFKLLRQTVVSNGGKCHGLSATPLLSSPDDLWGVLSALGLEKEAFTSYNNFLRIFNGRRVDFGGRFTKIVWGKPLPEAQECIRRVALGRKRENVLPDLPTKTYATYSVVVPSGLFDSFKNIDIEVLVNEPGQLSTERARIATVKSGASLGIIATLLESEPLVVFTTHKESAAILAAYFHTEPITGDTKPSLRGYLVDEFQNGNKDIIIGTVAAMGVGLTLTRSHHVVFVNRDWTPALNKQAEDRVCRIGQKNAVLVTDVLVDHPVEEVLYQVLMKKQRIIDASVESSRS